MIRWFARNPVAANLLMVSIMLAGLWSLSNELVLEVFPEFDSDTVRVDLRYRGATPAELEEGMVIKVEEAVSDLIGVSEIRSSAGEGTGNVQIEVAKGYDVQQLLDEVKNRVDAISTFPDEAERPTYGVSRRRREVIGVIVAGRLPERDLRRVGERVRDELVALPQLSQVELSEVRPYEISIELSERALQQYGLTFDEVTRAIARSSLDLPAGALKTAGGEIRLRTRGQSYVGADFEELVVRRSADGTQLLLADVATVHDGFDETPIEATFNGEPCVVLEVYRVGEQNAIEVAGAVKRYIEAARLPEGVTLHYWRDRSVIIEKRLSTLTYSAMQGGLLVLLLLGLFLRPRIAFWVTIGIPVSFLGALAVMPLTGVTINIVSLFAFILVLGIVVDDAIVTGENIYAHRRRGADGETAAIEGTREVTMPVVFGVLTTIVAFMPVAMLPGRRGTIFAQIPMIVVPVLLFSLVESKLVLPAHLRHVEVGEERGLARLQAWIANLLETFAEKVYQPVLRLALHWRYTTIALFVAGLLVVNAAVTAGLVRYVFFPRIQSETARGTLNMPSGTPFEVTRGHVRRMAEAAEALKRKHVDADGNSVIRDILMTAGSAGGRGGQSHIGRVTFEIVPPEDRGLPVTSGELVREWRQTIGAIPGAREVNYRAEIGRSRPPVSVELTGDDLEAMAAAAQAVKEQLADYAGVFDVSDSFSEGKPEARLKLKPGAEQLGLRLSDLARQVRQGFFGAQAQRLQRGREDLRVMVRYPRGERSSLGDLESMFVRTPAGDEVPFSEVAEVELGRGLSSITRVDRRRTVTVTADVDKRSVSPSAIHEQLRASFEALREAHPRVTFGLAGEAREQRDSYSSLGFSMVLVLLAIYALLAIPFRSYLQPLVVMAVIPFGWAGAVLGHAVMGMSMSFFSILGALALTGVVVNDSLVMIDFINRRRKETGSVIDAVRLAGVSRMRPILLTSLTTFAGLMPLIFERSTQAQFLIPMAVSLGCGVLFATAVTLILVPVTYLMLEDLIALKRLVWDFEE